MNRTVHDINAALRLAQSTPGRSHALDLLVDQSVLRASVIVNPSGFVSLTVRTRDQAVSNPAAREWIERGEVRFADIAEASRWLQATLTVSAPIAVRVPDTDIEHASRLASIPINPPSARVDPALLLSRLRQQVFGQDHVLMPLAEHVARHVARPHPRRPATLMFVGPTGVGKTATALCLSRFLTELLSESRPFGITRIDCSELGESHRRSQLFGAPQGYVGHGDGAQLLDDLARNSRRIVLFDEIEKAHPAVFQSIMAAMDAGRVSSPSRTANGSREVDCRAAIFVFTSNAEANAITDELLERSAFTDRAVVDQVCRSRLRSTGIAPELLGRVCAFFAFRPLTERAEAEVAALAVSTVAAEYGVQVTHVDAEVIASVLQRSQGSAYGARPIEYVVDELLGNAFTDGQACGGRPVRVVAGPPVACVAIDG